jgi:AcrR family transcriptional regulator
VTTSREPLTRERALAAAVDLADAEGLKALTMRRLAAALGVEAMSLYYHLPGKEGLLDGLASSVIAEIEQEVRRTDDLTTDLFDGPADDLAGVLVVDPADDLVGDPDDDLIGDPAGGWRPRLRARCLAARRVMLRHPWAPALLGTRPSVPPAVYAYFDETIGLMLAGGFSHRLAHRAVHALGTMMLGFVQELFTPTSAGGSTDPDTAEADLAAMAATVPHLTAMVAAEMHDATDPTLGWCDSQTEFEFTLDLLLDGLDRARTRR